MPARIADYAMIGDSRSAALISRTGSIDWLCWPRFDSPSLFGALLDPERGGSFAVAPAGPFRAERRYAPETNVLVTRFETAGGVVRLIDFVPAGEARALRGEPRPQCEIVRRVECTRGEVDLAVRFDPAPGFGLGRARVRQPSPDLVRVECREGLCVLRAGARMEPRGGGRGFGARVRLRAGDVLDFSLTFATEAPAEVPPLGERVDREIARTVAFWRAWAGRCAYAGPYRDAVVRSALALKLMNYAPSGAFVAAPTTSLPEREGGALNWDYRFCWLRDAAFTTRALFGLGYHDEACAYVDWLLHATRLTRPEVYVLYDVYGREAPAERVLPHLRGYRGSRPVRVGNGARLQLQLDVYGEVIDAVAQFCQRGARIDAETAALLRDMGRYVCAHWRADDEGIWEPRSGARAHTHSRVLCWVALDRLLALHERGVLRVPAAEFRDHREAIRREVVERGFNRVTGSYAQVLGGEEVDAALLLLPWYGFEPADSPRMRGTFARVRRELGAGGGMLYRYRPGSPEWREGAFGVCAFWAAEFLARGGGSCTEAHAWFARLLALSNDVGLYGEEFDPRTGDALGNFPQAFTHLGLINAALSLEERARAAPGRGRGPRRAGAVAREAGR